MHVGSVRDASVIRGDAGSKSLEARRQQSVRESWEITKEKQGAAQRV